MIVIDMDMPKTCEKCDITKCFFHGKEWFTVDEKKHYRNSRAEGCLIKCDIDDIKAEIKLIQKEDMECDGCSDMGMVLDIIDKQTAGSEDKE